MNHYERCRQLVEEISSLEGRVGQLKALLKLHARELTAAQFLQLAKETGYDGVMDDEKPEMPKAQDV